MHSLKGISILAMVFLVLLSSSNFMIGIHFCSDEIQNISFLTKAEACEMERELPPCHRHMTAPCCEDETIVHKGEELKNPVSALHIPAPLAMDLTNLHVILAEVVPAEPFAHASFCLYDPPLRWDDITIANQVFLI
jgi:hypothetical protein